MLVERVEVDGKPRFHAVTDHNLVLATHPESLDCYKFGCVIHFPSAHPLSEAPMNWRDDRGIMERICEHGIGHPDADSADYLERVGRHYDTIHGCDGCCDGKGN